MTLNERVKAIFAQGGWLESARGGHHLPEQLHYAQSVVEWINGEAATPVGLIEGETGTGKTLGYLFPLLLHASTSDQRVVISTHTIALQNQIIASDLEVVRDYFDEHDLVMPKVTQLLGRQQFVDPNRVRWAVASQDTRSPDHDLLVDWADECARRSSGRIDEWLECYGDLPDGITADQISMTSHSDPDINAGFSACRASIDDAQVVITSHSMIATELGTPCDLIGLNDEHPWLVVADEADHLPTAADDFMNRRLLMSRLRRLIEPLLARPNLRAISRETLRTLDEITSEAQRMNRPGGHKAQLFEDLERHNPRFCSLVRKLETDCDVLAKAAHRMRAKDSEKHWQEELIEEAKWVSGFSQQSSSMMSAPAVGWSEVRKWPSLMSYASTSAPIINRMWRSGGNRALMTSATLGGAESDDHHWRFSQFQAQIGVARAQIQLARAYSPKRFGAMKIVLADPKAPKPVEAVDETETRLSKAFIANTASMVREASRYGPVLVLTASFSEAAKLSKALSCHHTLHERGAALSRAIAAFRARPDILITPSAWQGTSIRGADGEQLIRNLVITRIPFKPPQGSMGHLFARMMTKAAINPIPELKALNIYHFQTMMAAVIKMRQGVGRLLRSPSDEGTVWIADPRFPRTTHSKHRVLRGAIPKRFHPQLEAARLFNPHSGRTEQPPDEPDDQLKEFVLL